MVGHLGVLDDEGVPRAFAAEAAPGLRFVGYLHTPRAAALRGTEAKRAAKAIAGELRAQPGPATSRMADYGDQRVGAR